jgi:hypothetical protein
LGLQPNTAYHYRIVVDNGTPGSPVFGGDMTVTTRVSDLPLSHGHFPGPPGSDRAYEQVNLPETGGNPVLAGTLFSNNGDRAVYTVSGGNPSSPVGTFLSQFFTERVETAPHVGGWKSLSVMPPRDELAGGEFLSPVGPSDISSFVAINSSSTNSRRILWRFSANAPAQKLFEPGPGQAVTAFYLGSSGSSRLVGTLEGAGLDPAYPAASTKENFYDVSSGTPRLANLLPGNVVSPCGNSSVVPFSQSAISADGKQFFFPGCSGQLYMREFEAEQTKLVSGPPLSGLQCGARLIKSVAGAAFLWTQTRLVADDTNPAACEGSTDGDVYRYDVGAGTFQCVTCVVPGADADVARPGVSSGIDIAVAEDGSRVYFQSSKRLLPGAPALLDGGLSSVYRVNVASGALRWIAGPGASAGDVPLSSTAISPDGSRIVFRSKNPGLNPLGEGARDNGGSFQYYLYDDNDRSLICVSCPPDGSPARSDVMSGLVPGGFSAGDVTPLGDDAFAFSDTEALTGADQNTARAGQDPAVGTDIYEWRDGRVLLVTDGLTNWDEPPRLNGVSSSGRDVYFTAPTQYTQDALDAYSRLYDARIGGGFEFPSPPKPCPLEVCQGTPKGAPEELPPGTGNFAGPGNVQDTQAKKKAHKKAHKKKSRKKHQHKTKRQQRAGHNGRTGR